MSSVWLAPTKNLAGFISTPLPTTPRSDISIARALDGSGTSERVTPSTSPGTHYYDISPDSHWAFHQYSRADLTPVTDLVEFPAHRSARVLEDNSALRANASVLLQTPTEFFKLDIGDGVTLDGWMMKPPHFDPAKKYPLLVYVYGEPAAQTVLDEWGVLEQLFQSRCRRCRLRGSQLR